MALIADLQTVAATGLAIVDTQIRCGLDGGSLGMTSPETVNSMKTMAEMMSRCVDHASNVSKHAAGNGYLGTPEVHSAIRELAVMIQAFIDFRSLLKKVVSDSPELMESFGRIAIHLQAISAFADRTSRKFRALQADGMFTDF